MNDFRIYQQNIQDTWEFLILTFSHFVKIRSRNSQGSWEFPSLLHILKFCPFVLEINSFPGIPLISGGLLQSTFIVQEACLVV